MESSEQWSKLHDVEIQYEKQVEYSAPNKDEVTNAIYEKYNIDNDVIPQVEQNQSSFAHQAPIKFKIKNLDTGEQEQIANEEQENIFSTRVSMGIKEIKTTNKSNNWDSFWEKVKYNNDRLIQHCQNGEYDQVQNLLKSGLNGYPVVINFKGLDEWTPLHYACYEGHDDIVELLLLNGANVNALTIYSRNALHIATIRNQIEVVKKLFQYKIDMNESDNDGNTALHFASQNGCKQIIQLLLQKKCVMKKNKEGQSPIDDCCDESLKEIYVKYGYKQTDKFQESSSTFKQQNKLQMELIRNKQDLTPDDFIYYKLLGKGSFGEVFLVRKKNTGDKLYAMKVLNKQRVISKNLKRYAITQRNVLSTINHPFMVKLFFAFQTSTKLFLVMDYYPGGDLGKLITTKKSLPQLQARKYIAQLILSLEALHKNMIIFRDLKPDNVVLDSEGHCRLTDFGLSKSGIYNNTTESFCGSVAYLAPEILSKQGHSRTVDWYLLGVLLYELIVGVPPYYNSKKEVLFDNIKKGPLRIPKSMSNEAKDIIKKLLCRDPSKRLGALRDSEQIKQHPFFTGINWNDVFNRKLEMAPIEDPKNNFNDTMKVTFSSTPDNNKKIQGWTFINNI